MSSSIDLAIKKKSKKIKMRHSMFKLTPDTSKLSNTKAGITFSNKMIKTFLCRIKLASRITVRNDGVLYHD